MSFNEIKPNIDDMEKNRDVEGLINALKFSDCIVRKEAAMAFKKIHDSRALVPLIYALKYQNWHDDYVVMGSVREYAAEALGILGDTEAVDPLIEALNDKDEEVRWKAAWALGNIGDGRAVDPLISSLSDERWYVRRYAASSLGRLKDNRSVMNLINALNDDEWQVRRYAAEALGEIGDERAIKPLVNLLSDNDGDVRWKAISSLGKMKKAAVEPLIIAFESEDWRIRTRIAEALGEIGDKRAVDVLINALIGKTKDNNRFVRGRVAEALGKIGDEKAIEPLIHALNDSYKYARIKAEEALERMNTTLFLSYDDDEDIAFDYPMSWEIISIYEGKKIVEGSSKYGEIKFSINKNNDLAGITLGEFADIIKNALTIQNSQIISETESEFDEIEIYKVIGESKSLPRVKIIIVALKIEDIIYYLWFTGRHDYFEEYKDEIDLIIDSFRMYY